MIIIIIITKEETIETIGTIETIITIEITTIEEIIMGIIVTTITGITEEETEIETGTIIMVAMSENKRIKIITKNQVT
jgi:hypothetical protein